MCDSVSVYITLKKERSVKAYHSLLGFVGAFCVKTGYISKICVNFNCNMFQNPFPLLRKLTLSCLYKSEFSYVFQGLTNPHCGLAAHCQTPWCINLVSSFRSCIKLSICLELSMLQTPGLCELKSPPCTGLCHQKIASIRERKQKDIYSRRMTYLNIPNFNPLFSKCTIYS